jgi:hypothetical protein
MPRTVRKVLDGPFFESQGHAYSIAYANAVENLVTTLTNERGVLDDPRRWEPEWVRLRSERKTGYFYGSEVRLPPIGAREIFEGQARFCQLQFLQFATGGLTWDGCAKAGMFRGVYGRAFRRFLKLTGLPQPASIDDPVIGLFMLLCDIAINPGAGFPMPIRFFEAFVTDVDPGLRFIFLCRTVAKNVSKFERAVLSYSRDEYEEISETLSKDLLIDSPLTIARRVRDWRDASPQLKKLMDEHSSFSFDKRQLVLRVLLSHFVSFCVDKYEAPEFFCWPGVWMTGNRASAKIADVFERQSAPFMDKPDDGGIYPRKMAGRDEAIVQKTFDIFYAGIVSYDLTRQWIIKPGPFTYDFSELSSTATQEEMKTFGDRQFEAAYNVAPDSFDLL